jgi:hypothetical protein
MFSIVRNLEALSGRRTVRWTFGKAVRVKVAPAHGLLTATPGNV